jgi:hypothetical protein
MIIALPVVAALRWCNALTGHDERFDRDSSRLVLKTVAARLGFAASSTPSTRLQPAWIDFPRSTGSSDRALPFGTAASSSKRFFQYRNRCAPTRRSFANRSML